MSVRKRNKESKGSTHKCGECALCEVEMKFETLNLKGNPTLGRCPHYTNKKFCVLLSQIACEHFKTKNG